METEPQVGMFPGLEDGAWTAYRGNEYRHLIPYSGIGVEVLRHLEPLALPRRGLGATGAGTE